MYLTALQIFNLKALMIARFETAYVKGIYRILGYTFVEIFETWCGNLQIHSKS